MDKSLEVLEEIYLKETPCVDDVIAEHSKEIVRYILDLKLVDWFMNDNQDPVLKITNKGIGLLKEYEIID